MCCRDPGGNRIPRWFGNLKLDRSLGLLLHDNRSGSNPIALDHIVNLEPDQIARAQLAIDGEVEQREFPGSMAQLQPNPKLLMAALVRRNRSPKQIEKQLTRF